MTAGGAVGGLAGLEARIREDLDCLNYPAPNWLPPTEGVSDVIIVGAGMAGLAAAFALRQHGILNLRILDQSRSGLEGPWDTYARMETLRSPKHLVGPATGLASVTFRSWFEAQFGVQAWNLLGKIPRRQWMDYLRWYRRVLDLPVENETRVNRIDCDGSFLTVDVDGHAGRPFRARKVVLATGRDGLGRPNLPPFVQSLERTFWAHSADAIDFARLRGKQVIVVGAGASAMDNAGAALEAGAAVVRVLIRRRDMPRINKIAGITHPGFAAGFPALPDDWRWRFMHYSFTTQTPAPRDSVLRVSRHSNAHFHFRAAITGVERQGDVIVARTADGRSYPADFLILATGFTVDPDHRPELAHIAHEIATWGDRCAAPPGCESREIERYPYLGAGFEFIPKADDRAAWLRHVYCFNYAASLSLGKLSGDIPAIGEGAEHLARSIAARLYVDDLDHHWRQFTGYATPELEGDEWTEAAR